MGRRWTTVRFGSREREKPKHPGENGPKGASERPEKESIERRTVLETDTGGWVRNALRLKENQCKGTRPIDSVTSGEGELVWEQISRRE